MAKFCPECGTKTQKRIVGGQERDACPDCSFVEFAPTKIGVGALVFRGEAVLLVERNTRDDNPFWTIPSGYIERGERLPAAVEREVKEETGLVVQAHDLILVRNMDEHGKNDIYAVFLCVEEDATATPIADEDESLQARFIHPHEFDAYALEDFSRWLVEQYVQRPFTPLPLVMVEGYEDAVVYANFTV